MNSKRIISCIIIFYLIFINIAHIGTKAEQINNIKDINLQDTDIEDYRDEDKQITFSLQKAIDHALEYSPLIAISETNLEKAKVNLKEAEQAEYDADKIKWANFEILQVKKGYFTRMARMGVTLSEAGKIQTVESIKFGIESSYFNLLNAYDNLDINKGILEVSEENLNNTKARYDIGMASLLEMIGAENALAQARYELRVAERELEYMTMNFNKSLGLPFDTEVVLTDKLTIEDPSEIDLAEGIRSALENRFEIIRASEEYKVEQLNFDIVSSYYTANTYKYQKAKYDLESKEYTFNNKYKDIELSVRKAYIDMLNAYESIAILDNAIEQIEKVYAITKTKFDNGMTTNLELLEALNQTKEFRLNRTKAVLGYNLMKKQYEISCGIGLPAGM